MHSSYCSIHFLWPFQRVWWRLLSLLRNQMWSLILIRKSDENLPNHWVCTISCLCNKKWVGRCGVNDFSYWRFAEISWIFEKRHLPFNYWLDCFSLIEHMNAAVVNGQFLIANPFVLGQQCTMSKAKTITCRGEAHMLMTQIHYCINTLGIP